MSKIVSAPIRIKLLDTSAIYQQDQTEYPQMTIEPVPSHYPQWIDSSQNEPLCTTDAPVTTSCFFDMFCCK
jgi:hypothetical protein